MKNIYLLPTDKLSRLRIGDNGNFVFGLMQSAIVSKNDFFTNHNIYITNDEEIKVGDFVYPKRGFIGKFGEFENSYFDECKKIILTDNEDLIKNGVQPIDDVFLEWFVENPSCEEVGVKLKQHFQADKLKRKNPLNGVYYSYKIIIPKVEPHQHANLNTKPK